MYLIGAVEIGDSLQRGLDEFVAFLPRLVGFLIILLIGCRLGAWTYRTPVSRDFFSTPLAVLLKLSLWTQA